MGPLLGGVLGGVLGLLLGGLAGLSAGPAHAQDQAPSSPSGPSARSTLAAPLPVAEEVPFITTPDAVTLAMLQLAGVGPRDHVLDLGSGDGRIVITAARRFGATGLGVEIDPQLVARSRVLAEQAGVAGRVRFLEQDLFATDLAPATVVTMYLLPEVNLQLRPRLLALKPGTRLVSHDWDMGDWLPDRSLTLDVPEKAIGRDKQSRVHLWVVPAPVAGLWCASGGRSLVLRQAFQQVSGLTGEPGAAGPAGPLGGPAARHGATAVFGHLEGALLQLQASGGAGTASLRLQAVPSASPAGGAGPMLQVSAAAGPWAGWSGLQFTRTSGERCPA